MNQKVGKLRQVGLSLLVVTLFICVGYGLSLAQDEYQYIKQGENYWGMGKLNEAISEFEKALKVNPNSTQAYHGLGRVHFKQGLNDQALKELEKAISLEPEQAWVRAWCHITLGQIYAQKGEKEKAKKEFETALLINATQSANITAQAWLERLSQTGEEHGHLQKANEYWNKNEIDKAIAEFEKAIEINPNLAEAHSGLGRLYHKKGLYKQAIPELKKAIELQPKQAWISAWSYVTLGWIYEREGKLKEAKEAFTSALELNATKNVNRAAQNGLNRLR